VANPALLRARTIVFAEAQMVRAPPRLPLGTYHRAATTQPGPGRQSAAGEEAGVPHPGPSGVGAPGTPAWRTPLNRVVPAVATDPFNQASPTEDPGREAQQRVPPWDPLGRPVMLPPPPSLAVASVALEGADEDAPRRAASGHVEHPDGPRPRQPRVPGGGRERTIAK